MRQCFFQYSAKVFRLGDAPAFHAEGGSHGGVIGGVEVNREVALAIA